MLNERGGKEKKRKDKDKRHKKPRLVGPSEEGVMLFTPLAYISFSEAGGEGANLSVFTTLRALCSSRDDGVVTFWLVEWDTEGLRTHRRSFCIFRCVVVFATFATFFDLVFAFFIVAYYRNLLVD